MIVAQVMAWRCCHLNPQLYIFCPSHPSSLVKYGNGRSENPDGIQPSRLHLIAQGVTAVKMKYVGCSSHLLMNSWLVGISTLIM